MCGAVAQLGERLTGSQEVDSSILFSSTKKIQGVSLTANPFFFVFFFAWSWCCKKLYNMNKIAFCIEAEFCNGQATYLL